MTGLIIIAACIACVVIGYGAGFLTANLNLIAAILDSRDDSALITDAPTDAPTAPFPTKFADAVAKIYQRIPPEPYPSDDDDTDAPVYERFPVVRNATGSRGMP